jgi:hypothetical protein
MRNKQPPKAVKVYMTEYTETEEEVRDYIRRQLKFFVEIKDKADTTVERWIGFKLGCTASAAKTAIRWTSIPAKRSEHIDPER